MPRENDLPMLASKQEYAYQQLKDMIISNRFEPGTILVERNLSELLNISRTPVRAALNQLANENLVVLYPGRGMAVSPVRVEDVLETYVLREVLDILAVKLYMQNATKTTNAIMQDTVRRMESAYQEGEVDQVLQCDTRFHDVYLRNTGNRRLEAMLGPLMDHINRLLNLSGDDPGRMELSIRQHKQILNGILSEDVALAQDAMLEHILSLKEYHINRLIKSSGKQFPAYLPPDDSMLYQRGER